jgi:hypothetical protein
MVDVLAVRGLGLLGLHHPLLLGARRGPGTGRTAAAAGGAAGPGLGRGPATGRRKGSCPSRSPAASGSRSPASAKWPRGASPTWRSPATTDCPSGGASASTRPCTSARLPRRGRATSRRCTSSPRRRRGCCSAGCAGRSKTCASTPSGASGSSVGDGRPAPALRRFEREPLVEGGGEPPGADEGPVHAATQARRGGP